MWIHQYRSSESVKVSRKKFISFITISALVITVTCFVILGEGGWSLKGISGQFDRTGEIRYKFREDTTIKSVEFCESGYTFEKKDITKSNEFFIEVGYGVFDSRITYLNREKELKTVTFKTDKFNNWHKVLYFEKDDGSFTRFDNGIERSIEYEGP